MPLVIFLGGASGDPLSRYIEYAELEGAGFATRAFRITLPLITPSAFLVFVLAWINAFKIFKEVYFIAGAYPDYSVYTLQNYMNNMFEKLNYQNVTAAALFLRPDRLCDLRPAVFHSAPGGARADLRRAHEQKTSEIPACARPAAFEPAGGRASCFRW